MSNTNKSDISSLFDPEYYDGSYFADGEGKTYNKSDGTLGRWGYRNPEGEWFGCVPIVHSWKNLFNPVNNLDVGCGRGTFVAYMNDLGIASVGFDFSTWAIENHYPRCRDEWVKVHNVTDPWPYHDSSFDFVTALDLLEHIYEEDIEYMINEMYRVTRKWIFLQIATVGGMLKPTDESLCYILNKNKEIPVELEGCAIAGHVTMQTQEYWRSKLSRDGWVFRDDIVNDFINMTPKDVIRNWLCNTIIVIEKVE